ncbi:MAG: hypothetical protein ACLFVS_01660 [Candidatus Acetothermia bacterium]
MRKLDTLTLLLVLVLFSYPVQAGGNPDDGFVIAGSSRVFGGEPGRALLMKLAGEGEFVWGRTYGINDGQMGVSLTGELKDPEDRDFALIGKYGPTETEAPLAEYSPIVLRADPSGRFVWAKKFSREDGICFLNAVTWTDGGEMVAVGQVGPEGPEGMGTEDRDALVVKFAGDGTILWTYSYGGDLQEFAMDVIETEDKGILMVGETTLPRGQESAGDLWLVKLREDGSVEWQKSFGEPMKRQAGHFGVEIGYSVSQLENGDLVVLGTTRSFGKGGGARGDIWVMKLDRDGNVKWQKAYGGECLDTVPMMIRSSSGGYIIGSQSNSFAPWKDVTITSEVCGSTRIHHIWVFRIDERGEIVWQKVYGVDSREAPGSLLETGQDRYHFLASIEGKTSIFAINGAGELAGGYSGLRSANTEVSPLVTESRPLATSVSPQAIELEVSGLDLVEEDVDPSELSLPEG